MKVRHKRKFLLLLALSLLCIYCSPTFSQNLLKPGDKIRIWVKGEPELSLEKIIKPNGYIDYPLIGEIKLSNLTITQAAKAIAKALDDGYLRDPLVQVSLIENKSTNQQTLEDNSTLDKLKSNKETRELKKIIYPQPLLIAIVDKLNNQPIPNVNIFLNNKIYQSNRKGQVLLSDISGNASIFADGYEFVEDNLENLIEQVGDTYRITLEPVKLLPEVIIKVLNSHDNLPVSNVIINFGNNNQVVTNWKGEAVVKNTSNKEYQEISLSKVGFNLQKKVISFRNQNLQKVYLTPKK